MERRCDSLVEIKPFHRYLHSALLGRYIRCCSVWGFEADTIGAMFNLIAPDHMKPAGHTDICGCGVVGEESARWRHYHVTPLRCSVTCSLGPTMITWVFLILRKMYFHFNILHTFIWFLIQEWFYFWSDNSYYVVTQKNTWGVNNSLIWVYP